jgi:hypothetical protein
MLIHSQTLLSWYHTYVALLRDHREGLLVPLLVMMNSSSKIKEELIGTKDELTVSFTNIWVNRSYPPNILQVGEHYHFLKWCAGPTDVFLPYHLSYLSYTSILILPLTSQTPLHQQVLKQSSHTTFLLPILINISFTKLPKPTKGQRMAASFSTQKRSTALYMFQHLSSSRSRNHL